MGIRGVRVRLALLAWSVRFLIARTRRHGRASPPRRWPVLSIPLLFDVAILWAAFIYLPEHFDSPLRGIIRAAPDAGIFIVIAIGIAALWGTTRTILLLRKATPAVRDDIRRATN